MISDILRICGVPSDITFCKQKRVSQWPQCSRSFHLIEVFNVTHSDVNFYFISVHVFKMCVDKVRQFATVHLEVKTKGFNHALSRRTEQDICSECHHDIWNLNSGSSDKMTHELACLSRWRMAVRWFWTLSMTHGPASWWGAYFSQWGKSWGSRGFKGH